MAVVVLVAAFLTACALTERRHTVDNAAVHDAAFDTLGFVLTVVPTAAGPVRVWQRGLAGARQVHVYIEGDGHAWESLHRPSADPTPRRAVARALAARDPAPAVIYLARPCQYADASELAACDKRYWTSHRYAEVVITALDLLLNAQVGPSTRLGLVGYSGGAAIAALLAVRRDDVDWLISIAGNLDLSAWAAHHGVSALDGSLDPRHVLERLTHVPQVLLLGAEDSIVPPAVLDDYRAAAGGTLVTQEYAGFDHSCCWVTVWPSAGCEMLTRAGVNATAYCTGP